MSEKIKIYLTNELKETLLKDASNFGFLKSNGDVNINNFINTLIVNYYEEHQNKQKYLYASIQNILSHSSLSVEERNRLSEEITHEVQTIKNNQGSKKASASISFKPTKNSETAVEYIERVLLQNHSLSSYYASMFASYASLPQDKRELILFKDINDIIQKAIESKQTIIFTMNQGNDKYMAAPYKIAASFEELHNYILATILSYNDAPTQQPSTFRLSKIERLSIHEQKYAFHEEEINVYTRALRNGVQFIYHSNDQPIKVHLNEPYGKRMFERFYVHRPLPTKIEGNDYYFDCSYNQLINYFARFGSNAVIEYPTDLAQRMAKIHFWAYKKYNYKPGHQE